MNPFRTPRILDLEELVNRHKKEIIENAERMHAEVIALHDKYCDDKNEKCHDQFRGFYQAVMEVAMSGKDLYLLDVAGEVQNEH